MADRRDDSNNDELQDLNSDEEKIWQSLLADLVREEEDIEIFLNRNFPEINREPSLENKKVEDLTTLEEFDNEDEVASKILGDLKTTIKDEWKDKRIHRNWMSIWLVFIFTSITGGIGYMVYNSNEYETAIILVLIGGFFANFVTLLMVLLKYLFSPSNELYNYSIDILKRKNNKLE